MRASAASILAISLRWRSRALSSSARSVSDVARSAMSACCAEVLVQHVQRLAVLADDLFLPGDQLVAEVDAVPLVHERLALGRPVTVRQNDRATAARATCFFGLCDAASWLCPSAATLPRAVRARLAPGPWRRPSCRIGCCSFSPSRFPSGSLLRCSSAPRARRRKLVPVFKLLFFQVKPSLSQLQQTA